MGEPKKPTGSEETTQNPFKRFVASAGTLHDGFDWAAHTEAVSADVFGPCNEQMSRPPEDVRFGNKGSVSVDYTTGRWYDFENQRGGGVKELIRVYKEIKNRDEAIAYAKQCLNGRETASANGNAGEKHRTHSKGNKNGQRDEREATYPYRDAEGRVAFEVVRYVFRLPDGSYATGDDGKRSKKFAQRRPSGEPDGSWIWGLGHGEFMRSGPERDWVAFNAAKYEQYPKRTREKKFFDTAAPVVPYGLPELRKALAANQTILIPEGEKKVERIRELGFPAACNAGGAKKWEPEHTAYLKGADVVLLPDNDPVGVEHMEAIAKSLSTVAKRVRILNLPNLPPKGDIVDWQGTAEEFARLVGAAKDYIPDQRDAPQPLMRPMAAPEPFPIEALGSGLADAARCIADIVQAPIEMCGGAALGSASLAVSAHIDIKLPTGEIKPVSLYIFSIAESGERKTSVDNWAFAAQRKFEQKLRSKRVAELERYRVERTMWEAKSKAIARDFQKPGAAGSEGHQQELKKLGPEPVKPLEPLLTSADFTFEGMVRCLNIGQPIYGIIGSEGGQFVGGHGMTDEAKQRTVANLNDVWDGNPIKRVRAEETFILPGRRVGMHLGMQSVVAARVLTDELLIKLGFVGRIMMTHPASLIGTRLHKEPPPEARQTIAAFSDKVLTILETPYQLAEDTKNELNPRALPFSAEATTLYWEFADECEKAMAPGGEYELIKSFAAKLPEHAARLAATIAGYCDINVSDLGREDFLRGIDIATYYANEAKRIFESSWAKPELLLAQKLLDWLKGWPDKTISARDIYQYGPSAIRDRSTTLTVAQILVDHGWLKRLQTKRSDQNEWQLTWVESR